mgnify:CR=1 FL=1
MYIHVNLPKGHFLQQHPPAAAPAPAGATKTASQTSQTTPGLQIKKPSQEGKCKIKRYYTYILYVHFICTINMYILHVQFRKQSRQKR